MAQLHCSNNRLNIKVVGLNGHQKLFFFSIDLFHSDIRGLMCVIHIQFY